jgi:hypothetical protein
MSVTAKGKTRISRNVNVAMIRLHRNHVMLGRVLFGVFGASGQPAQQFAEVVAGIDHENALSQVHVQG